MRNTLNFYLIVRSQMLTLSSLTAVYNGEADLSYSLLCVHSIQAVARCLRHGSHTHTHVSTQKLLIFHPQQKKRLNNLVYAHNLD